MEPTIFGVPRPTGHFLKNGVSALGHLVRLLEAPVWLLGHHFVHQGRQFSWHLRTHEAERRGIHRLVSQEYTMDRGRLKRCTSAQKVIERTAEAVDVSADVGLLSIEDLLGARWSRACRASRRCG